jgi:TetR/AcrR family acrAB operon transcriptional repressor
MRKTKTEALKTRSKVLASAMKVFLDKGYSQTSLADIAKAAGYTRGAVYWHFEDKSEILEVLISRFHDRFLHKQAEIIPTALDPLQKVTEIININFLELYRNKEFRDFIELTWFKTEIDQHAGLLQGKVAITKIFNDSITLLFKEAAKMGILKEEIDPEIAALTVTSIINGIYRGYFVMPDKLQTEKVGKTLIENYLSQITHGRKINIQI